MKHDFTVVKLSGCHVMDDLMLTQLLAKVVSLSAKKKGYLCECCHNNNVSSLLLVLVSSKMRSAASVLREIGFLRSLINKSKL